MDKELYYQLKINGKDFGQVQAKANMSREHFVNYVQKNKPDFNPQRDTLEIIDLTPTPKTVLRHSARDKSNHNKQIDAILSRHVQNLIATYGENKLFKLLSDVHGLVKTDKKAS